MVWNITRDDIRVRMAVVDEDVWPPPPSEEPQVPDASLSIPFSDLISGGKLDVKDVIQPIYDEINEQYGLDSAAGNQILGVRFGEITADGYP
jgi:ribonuclease Z